MLKQEIRRSFLIGLTISTFSILQASAQLIIPPSSTDTGLGGGNTITGMVLTTNGQRIQRRISIRLETMTRGDRVAMTDDYGAFTLRGLVSGDYVIVIDKEAGFEPYSQNVSIIQMRGFPAQNYNLSIRLKPKPSTTVGPSVINAEFATVPKRALEFYDNAVKLGREGDHKAAIEQLKLAIAEHPRFMLAYNEIGVQYLRLNDLEKSEAFLAQALQIEPEAYTPLINRAIVLFQLKRFADSEALLRNALKVKVDSAVGHYFLGQVLANLGKFDEAEPELLTAIKLGGPEMKEAHRILSIIYSARGDDQKCLRELEAYVKLSPNAPDVEKLKARIAELKAKN